MYKTALSILIMLAPLGCFGASVNDEVGIAVKALQGIPEEERQFIKFFSSASIPDTEFFTLSDGEKISIRDAGILVFRFIIHSLSAGEVFADPVQISPTLWSIDIRDYRWTPESFEKVSNLDPYWREPWVDGQLYRALQLESGNAILRMDWFIVHTTDTTRQVDLGRTPLYYELTYSGGKIPETLNEFRKFWGVDIPASQANKTLTGTVVDKDQSGVSSQMRHIFRVRTILGYYYETQDVATLRNGDDYLENLEPDIRQKNFVAGESITTNRLRLQTYFLSNAKGKRIEVGDNQVVTDHTDIKDKRVKVAKSCMICHSTGLNITPNAAQDLLNLGVSLKTYPKEFNNDLLRFYFGEFATFMQDDNILYERAVKQANGLEPTENAKLFKQFYEWYDRPISIDQAARECFVTSEEIKSKCESSIRGRIAALTKGKPVHREAWEEIDGGVFGEIMLLLCGQQPIIPTGIGYVVTEEITDIYSGKDKLGEIPAGTRLEILETQDGWGKIEFNGIKGWVKLKNETS